MHSDWTKTIDLQLKDGKTQVIIHITHNHKDLYVGLMVSSNVTSNSCYLILSFQDQNNGHEIRNCHSLSCPFWATAETWWPLCKRTLSRYTRIWVSNMSVFCPSILWHIIINPTYYYTIVPICKNNNTTDDRLPLILMESCELAL